MPCFPLGRASSPGLYLLGHDQLGARFGASPWKGAVRSGGSSVGAEATLPPAYERRSGSEDRYRTGELVAGKYQLVRRLGAGGMGVVWVAHNQVLDVHVALKIISPGDSNRPKQLLARVLQEARAAARLTHPAICRVFDFGDTAAGDPFIVSELLHGETLAEQLESQPRIPALRAVQLLLPIADGLSVAHSGGIIHRDVKPENIFLSRDGVHRIQPKLLDFGIARFVEADQKLTLDGTLLGTPDYMSPEQARGEAGVDPRTDVWSLCVVLYELVTGTAPFRGDNYNALLWSIAQEDPRPTVDQGAGDDALWQILRRGLAKKRDDRWSEMRELGEALAYWLHASGVNVDVGGSTLQTTWLEPASLRPQENPELPGRSRPRSVEVQQLLQLPNRTLGENCTVPAPPFSNRSRASAFGLRELGELSGALRASAASAVEPSRPPRQLFWGVAGVACVLGLVFGVLLVSRTESAPKPSEPSVPAGIVRGQRTAASARVPGGPAVPPSSVVALPSAEPVAVASAVASAPVPLASAGPVPSSRRSVGHRGRSKSVDPRSYDFGF